MSCGRVLKYPGTIVAFFVVNVMWKYDVCSRVNTNSHIGFSASTNLIIWLHHGRDVLWIWGEYETSTWTSTTEDNFKKCNTSVDKLLYIPDMKCVTIQYVLTLMINVALLQGRAFRVRSKTPPVGYRRRYSNGCYNGFAYQTDAEARKAYVIIDWEDYMLCGQAVMEVVVSTLAELFYLRRRVGEEGAISHKKSIFVIFRVIEHFKQNNESRTLSNVRSWQK